MSLTEITPQLATVAEFQAAYPNIFASEQAVYQAIREDLLPHVRIGRRVHVDLDRWRDYVRQGGKAHAGGWRKQAGA